jgi:chaperone required for assembly of F1-ATPase
MAASTKWKGVKRFYTRVEARPLPATETPPPTFSRVRTGRLAPHWWTVEVQGRRMRTSGMNPLLLPSADLAHAIATEFRMQRDTIQPTSTPLYNLASAAIDTYVCEDVEGNEEVEAQARAGRLSSMGASLSGTAQDGTTPSHALSSITGRNDSGAMTSSGVGGTGKLRDLVLDFLETDTVCFRVDPDSADPSELILRKRQDKYYGPLLSWWKSAFGVDLGVVEGFKDVAHPEAAYVVAEDAVDQADAFLRAAVHHALTNTKSTVLTLALVHGAVDVDTAFECSRVEEEFQIRENGFVEDGHDVTRAAQRVALSTVATFLSLCPASAPAAVPLASRKDYAAALAAAEAARSQRVSARRAREAGMVAAARKAMKESE